MLNASHTEDADVALAQDPITINLAVRLKNYLCGPKFVGKWYYCGEDKSKNLRLSQIIHGLGCEGVELTKPYWAIMRNHGLLHSTEEEEHRRFAAAPVIAPPKTSFATSICHLLYACFRACQKTKQMTIDFVQAGNLNLELFFLENELVFRVHERWLSRNDAVTGLGLRNDLAEADVAFHAVKRLFAEVVKQMPDRVFLEDDKTRTAEWQRQLETSCAEQRLLDHLRMGTLTADRFSSLPGLLLKWSTAFQPTANAEVEIQCYRASHCSHLRTSVLISEDAPSKDMACIVPLTGRGSVR